MLYDVVFDNGFDQEQVEMHAVSRNRLRKKMQDFMDEYKYTYAEVYSKNGNLKFTYQYGDVFE